jgi:hypothetical protein
MELVQVQGFAEGKRIFEKYATSIQVKGLAESKRILEIFQFLFR